MKTNKERRKMLEELGDVVRGQTQPPVAVAAHGSARCEGWRRYGGEFTLGPVTWKQCEAQGIVTLKFKDPDSGKVKTLPACKECWAECLATGVTIIEARPIAPNAPDHRRRTEDSEL